MKMVIGVIITDSNKTEYWSELKYPSCKAVVELIKTENKGQKWGYWK